MIQVSEEVFYSYIAKRDVIVECKSDRSLFILRGGPVVGQKEGYKCSKKIYLLTETALQTLEKENSLINQR